MSMPSRLSVVLFVAGLSVAASSTVLAETVTLDCVDEEGGTCPSHWVIDGDTQMVTWHWCDSPDTTEKRNVVITANTITFDEEFMSRHYEFDRRTGVMTITSAGTDGVRFDDGSSVCHAPR